MEQTPVINDGYCPCERKQFEQNVKDLYTVILFVMTWSLSQPSKEAHEWSVCRSSRLFEKAKLREEGSSRTRSLVYL